MNTNVFKADHFEPLLISPSWMSTITHLSLFAAHRLRSAVLFFWKTCLCQKTKKQPISRSVLSLFLNQVWLFFVCDMKRVYLCTCYLLVWTAGAVVEHTLCSDSAEFFFFFHAALMSEILKIASCSRANRLIYTCLRWCRVSF